MAEPSSSTPASDKHKYATPFGKMAAQVRGGSWVVVQQLTPPPARREEAGRLLRAAVEPLRAESTGKLPRPHAVDAAALRCTWVLPDPGLVPLASLGSPLSPDATRAVIRSVAAALADLHRAGTAAYDLSPGVFFAGPAGGAAAVVPSPWLPSLARWSPADAARVPGLAPELSTPGGVDPDTARADVFALGSLAWLLLTGRPRRPGELPGQVRADLSGWDAFVDGCCRSNPDRRFGGVADALASLDAPAPTPVTPTLPPPTPLSSPGGRRRLSGVAMSAAAACLLAVCGGGLCLFGDRLATAVPALAPVLAGYRRGFGDTVVSYADRTYDGSAWVKLKEADSLADVASASDGPGRASALYLRGVTGWDRDDFWVVADDDRGASVFRLDRGHWKFRGRLKNASYGPQRLLDRDTLVVAGSGDRGQHVEGRVYEVTPAGVVDHGDLDTSVGRGVETIAPVAADLYFVLGPDQPVVKVADGRRTDMDADKYKEAHVHRADNTPLKEFYAGRLRHARGPAAGRAAAVAWKGPFHDKPYKLVTFEAGIWYDAGDLPDNQVNDAWYGWDGGRLRFAVTVGADGHAHLQTAGGPGLDVSVPHATEPTSMRLVKAWGVDERKYWVMDDCGTVWQRDGTEWRAVVRGMRRDGVEFRDAWVAPSGAVVAVTDKAVYRLD